MRARSARCTPLFHGRKGFHSPLKLATAEIRRGAVSGDGPAALTIDADAMRLRRERLFDLSRLRCSSLAKVVDTLKALEYCPFLSFSRI